MAIEVKIVTYIVGAELIHLDTETGDVVGKERLEPQEIMGKEKLVEWAAGLEQFRQERTQELNGNQPQNRKQRRSQKKPKGSGRT